MRRAEIKSRDGYDKPVGHWLRKVDQCQQYGWKAEAAYNALEVMWDHMYEADGQDSIRSVSEEDVIAYGNEVAKPIVQYVHGNGDEPDIDMSEWRDLAQVPGTNDGFEYSPGPSRAPNTDPEDHAYRKLRDAIEAQVDEDDFDYVIGVAAGGIAPMHAVTDYLDAEEVIARYSPNRIGDTDVQRTPAMDEKSQFDGSDVLIVDDAVNTGSTLQYIGDFAEERGADQVYALPMTTISKNWNVSDGGELLERADAGHYYRA